MTLQTVAAAGIAGVWIFHGVYSKLLNRIPRHREIVGRVLGSRLAAPVTMLIGAAEVLVGVWVLAGIWRVPCAAVQTAALLSMNALEIWRARDLLISPAGMLALNAAFLALVWWWALHAR